MKRAKRSQRKKAEKTAMNTKLGQAENYLPEQQTLTLQQALNLAVQHHNGGRLPEAEIIYQQILQADPNQPDALHLLGLLAHQGGKSDIAVDLITKALTIKPDYTEAYNSLAIALKRLGRLDEAVASYHKALTINPDYIEAYNNLGNALKELGRLDDAVDSYNKALVLKPDYAEAHYNLGLALRQLGQLDDAVDSYNKAVDLKPDYAEAHNNLGIAFKDLGKLDEAIASFHKAVALNPDYAEAHNSFGNALKEQGKLDEAVARYRKAINLKPDYAEAHSNLIMTLTYAVDHTPKESLAQARHYGAIVAARATPAGSHSNLPDPARRLRVGLVSGDFRDHSVSYFLEDILSEIDKEKLEIFAYSTFAKEDDRTARLKSIVANWRKVAGISDKKLAKDIVDDGIDILVDLSGHTAHNRLPLFSWKPAPIQVTWLGYGGTTGVEAMDYIFCDRLIIPPSDEAYYVEKPWRLPDIWVCFSSPDLDIDVGALPALANGHITFGSFNNLTKMTNRTVACWARVLQAVPDSRLLLKAMQLGDATVQEETYAGFEAHGIDRQRLTFRGRSPGKDEYFRTYNEMDIALDPFPYCGGTTSIEALWMGTPVLTLKGDSFVSHMGESILHNVGLDDWIADTPEDYIEKATAFASDFENLSTLRKELRNQLLTSPLCNPHRFAHNLEDALRGMWKEWCQ